MKRWIAILLIGIGLIVLLLLSGALLYGWFSARTAESPLPERVLGVPLEEKVTASEAVNQINRLHNKDFPLSSGAVGIYGPERDFIIWVGQTRFSFQAPEVIADMHSSIAEGRFPFIPSGELLVDGIPVYLVESEDEMHFYFRSGATIVWAAVNSTELEAAIQELVDFYQ